MIEIALHELIHAYFEEPYFKPLVEKYKDGFEYAELKEIFASALLPNGCLSRRRFKERLTNMQKTPPKYQAGFELMPWLKDYIKNKKKIDENLIKNGVKILQKERGTL